VARRAQVDDRQPAVSESDAGLLIDPRTLVIRAAVGDWRGHPADERLIDPAAADEARNPAQLTALFTISRKAGAA